MINEADNLTRDAQSALRRTMEKYSPNIRLILVANSSTKILSPIRSRCLLVRVAAPTNEDVVAALKAVVAAESLGKVGAGVLEKIAVESKRNLRRSLLMLEAVYAQKYQSPFVFYTLHEFLCSSCLVSWRMGTLMGSGRLDDPKITIVPPDWEVYVQQVADQIVSEQSPQRCYRLYNHH